MLGERRWGIYRRTGEYIDGEYVVTNRLLLRVYGVLQPLAGRELELVPESIRQRAQFRLFIPSANAEVIIGGMEGRELGDMILVGDRFMELHSVSQYDPNIAVGLTLQHREFVVVGPARSDGRDT